MIRNILFDLDDTLLDFGLAERIAIAKTLERFGIEPRPERLARYSELNLAQWKLLERGLLHREEVKTRRFQLLFEDLGAACSPAEAARHYERLLGVGHYFMDGAEALLHVLQSDYRLYLVTNGTAAVQERRIESAGLARFFAGIFISERIGFHKPDTRFFNFCFARIPDFERRETLIVGDSLSSDIKGGRDAGIRTVWFNPRGAEGLEGVVPDYELRRLSDLPALLKGL